jgi:hypothetical protein
LKSHWATDVAEAVELKTASIRTVIINVLDFFIALPFLSLR